MRSIFLLIRFSVRHLFRHRGQTLLLMTGILLGVAVVIAVDYANESSKIAIELSTQSVTGKATHQIISSGGEIPEQVITSLIRSGEIEAASPIVEGYVNVTQFNQQPVLVLGVDPILDFPFREYYGDDKDQLTQLISIMSEPESGIISKELATEYEVTIGDSISYIYEGKSGEITIVGLISSNEPIIRESLKGLIVVDIATAQNAFQKIGLLDRIELIIKDSNQVKKLEQDIPSGLVIRSTIEQNDQIQNMIGAFQLNLTALSLLALVVGGFLIYNTMTYSVIQRRELIGLYRSLGFHRSEIFFIIILEAFLIGSTGTLFGVVFGILLGQQTVNLILQTINDLYFVTTVRSVSIPMISILKGVLLGILATILVSIPPAVEAMRVTPRLAKIRSDFEERIRKNVIPLAVLILILLFLSYLLLFSSYFDHLWWAFTATLLVVLAFSILASLGLFLLLPLLSRIFKKYFGLISGMAIRELYRSLSRTAVAVSSLMVAVSVTIGMALMINSFRYTVSVWLHETLSGDIYISIPNQFSNRSSAYIDKNVVEEIYNFPGIEKIDSLLTIYGISEQKDMQINVVTNNQIGNERIFTKLAVPVENVWANMLANEIIISEPLANRFEVKIGDSIMIESPAGKKEFKILGIFTDYTSSQGYLMMARPVYEKYWGIDEITAISINFPETINIDEKVRELKAITSSFGQDLLIRSNQNLRNDVLVVFDRTFAVTNALRFIATLVSFIGILSATLIFLLDRKREFGLLKAIGFRRKELNQLMLMETGVMGLFAGVFAIPTGLIISLILVYIINLRSFGWTIQFYVNFWSISQGVLIAVLASLIAAIYPILRLNKLNAIEAIRNE